MKRYRCRCVKARRAVSRKGVCTRIMALSCKTLALSLPLGERLTLDVDYSLRSQCQGRETLPKTTVNSTPKTWTIPERKTTLFCVTAYRRSLSREERCYCSSGRRDKRPPYSNADHYRPCQEADCRREQGERADRRDCKAEKGERRSCMSF